MPVWTTSTDTYVLPDSLEDIGETIGGTRNGLAALGFGSEVTGSGEISGTQAAKDNGETFVSISFVFMGGRTFSQIIVIYMHGTTDGGQLDSLFDQVNNAINFTSG
jgi:hypothetical protein